MSATRTAAGWLPGGHRTLAAGAVLLLALGACASDIAAPSGPNVTHVSPSAFWSGLPASAVVGRAGGAVALKPAPTGRVRMPGGSFTMGSTINELRDVMALCLGEPLGLRCETEEVKRVLLAEAPAHAVTVSPYALDRTEVTVAAYRRCVASGVCPPPTRGDDDPRFNRPELPVTFVSWEAAAAFCAWAGGRLPTEAEWELAARGPEGRVFPWGNVYNPYLCNHGSLANDPTDARDGYPYLAPIGSFPDGATPLGILDLAGNAAEWVADFYELDENGFGYPQASQVNPKGRPGSVHVVRGGDYTDAPIGVRGAARSASHLPRATIGFRCAADVE